MLAFFERGLNRYAGHVVGQRLVTFDRLGIGCSANGLLVFKQGQDVIFGVGQLDKLFVHLDYGDHGFDDVKFQHTCAEVLWRQDDTCQVVVLSVVQLNGHADIEHLLVVHGGVEKFGDDGLQFFIAQ